MGSAGERLIGYSGALTLISFNPILGDRSFALFGVVDLVGPIIDVEAESQIYLALGLSNYPVQYGLIAFEYFPILELDR